jgi:hypothetical protein
MADVTYRFAGIPYGVEASVGTAADPGTEIDTVTGTINGYGDLALPVGDYVATFTDMGQTHVVAGDLASPTDTDYAETDTNSAAGVSYDNTTSELTATDVQAALDEIVARIVVLETP